MTIPKPWIVLGVGILVALIFGLKNDIHAFFFLEHHDHLQGAEDTPGGNVSSSVAPQAMTSPTALTLSTSTPEPQVSAQSANQPDDLVALDSPIWDSEKGVPSNADKPANTTEESLGAPPSNENTNEGDQDALQDSTNATQPRRSNRLDPKLVAEIWAERHYIIPLRKDPEPAATPETPVATPAATEAATVPATTTPPATPVTTPALGSGDGAAKQYPILNDKGEVLDDGIRYGRFDEETLDDETFNQALRRGALKELPVVLVVTSYGWPPRFPLDWIKRQPWPAMVFTKEPGKGMHSEPWGNVGQEDVTYFHFITKHYDDLPERMVFLHGHNKAWHQESYLMEYLLRNACFDEHEYMSMNAFPAIRAPKGQKANEWKIIRKYWKPLGQGRLGPFPSQGLREKCCAQFMVHRDRVLRHPKSFYELQRNEMSDHKKTYLRSMKKMGVHVGFDLVLFYESIWHVMWGEKPWMTDEKYGTCVDKDIERVNPTIKNKVPNRCMQKVIHCPQPLCTESPTCSKALEEAKYARGKG
uniref:Uncharacterized protein n=1 Tax=Pyramimonas obovata TaxID=1411642 RepID=A0A7S0R439_9CHLO|mmetsp:Transcript_25174/g.54803  ORF Transcript_25174/g.54803 Transcript_25174/m.54803 type:complete len:530 (+) Transcript_25174:201-1790(+)|eukprot:CAMPEP_0118939764 /NCGR_PEP_ID=MMETSP1169-20130426/29721_1 /TAXON_ID=36882 /ORGANISM="Pyramimonas obovata, Strain CCMP722" /LENGTH=529 /DNA_ID=CAMNT_0006884101 /DNA_START=133 /DNA_END=1722 /DNA_ORIENTATION=+